MSSFTAFRRSTSSRSVPSMVALGTVTARTLLPCDSGMPQIFLKFSKISSLSTAWAISLEVTVSTDSTDSRKPAGGLLCSTKYYGPVERLITLLDYSRLLDSIFSHRSRMISFTVFLHSLEKLAPRYQVPGQSIHDSVDFRSRHRHTEHLYDMTREWMEHGS